MTWVQKIICVLLMFPVVSEASTYCDNNCQPVSETNYKFYCVASDANKFTRCVHGRRHIFDCARGFVYDPATTTCNWPSAAAHCSCDGNHLAPIPSETSSRSLMSQTQTPLSTPSSNNTGTGNKLSICYFTNWSQYRPGAAKFKTSNIDVSLCTHILYAFLNFDVSKIFFHEWNEEEMIGQIMALKQSKPSLKVIASIGGWNAGAWTFREIIASSTSRSSFNRNAIEFLRTWKFDGLDVDFEYPGKVERGSSPKDKPLFTAWIQSLREDFEAESSTSGQTRLILGAAIAGAKEDIDNGYELPEISAALDFVAVMTYDYYVYWESGLAAINAPLFSKWPEGTLLNQLTASWTVDYLLTKGVPAHKMVMGIPFYGRSFTLVDPRNHGIGASVSGPGLAGRYTRSAGMNSYYETCMLLGSEGYTYVYDEQLQVPYIYKETNWISTEDTRSVKAKAEYARQKHLGGVMVWALDFDDFSGMCDNDVTYPLMRTIVNTFYDRP